MLLEDDGSFEDATGIRVVGGLHDMVPTLKEAVRRLDDGAAPQWSTHLFVDPAQRNLVGVGGYSHAPLAGSVEIAYYVVPELRGKGYATSATSHLVSYAAAAGVRSVTAYTPGGFSPAAAVLRRLQFVKTHDLIDPERGAVWRWERHVAGQALLT